MVLGLLRIPDEGRLNIFLMLESSITKVESYLLNLQKRICSELEFIDEAGVFQDDRWSRKGGKGITTILSGGTVFEQAGVSFSHVQGEKLPQAASDRKPSLIGSAFRAMGVSVVIHPLNPYVPTSHMNVRFFLAEPTESKPVWWFGGGFDLTPFYGFKEDALHWHRTARDACQKFGAELYPLFKRGCDEYFRLHHRGEQRGIGGVFFDDFNDQSFDHAFGLAQSIGDYFLPAYLPIVKRRKGVEFGTREREFQLYRRGRYVEFNLVCDRGTKFGLQSGGRTESILMSLPPKAMWRYKWPINPDTPEETLQRDFLQPRDWLVDS